MLSMALYISSLRSFKFNASRREQPTITFIDAMKVAARVHWWPTLAHLKRAKYRGSDGSTSMTDAWRELGLLLGFNVKQERERHEEEARNNCSWRDCPRRGEVTSEGKPALRKCAGCGEAKYCSRECQLRYRDSCRLSCNTRAEIS